MVVKMLTTINYKGDINPPIINNNQIYLMSMVIIFEKILNNNYDSYGGSDIR